MFDIFKVTLLEYRVINITNFFSDDSIFIKFFLQNCLKIAKFLFSLKIRGNAQNFTYFNFFFSFYFVSFGLEMLHSFLFTKLDKKVNPELVCFLILLFYRRTHLNRHKKMNLQLFLSRLYQY